MTRLITISLLLGTLIFSISSCKKDEDKKYKPLLTTTQVNEITPTTAKSGGSITVDGGAPVIARGVIWSTTQNPTLESNAGKTTDGTGTGNFSSNLTDLTPNTTYYVCAYATNSVGTNYGTETNFKTLDGVVALRTSTISNITLTTATGGGSITADGGAPVIARGVIWGITRNPTLDNNAGKTNDGMGTGNFTSGITRLTPNTTYYVRAYATNSVGTTYGNETIVKTMNGTLSDSDGNVYYTVSIGSQVWMAENLKTTKYNNGTSISNVIDATAWSNLTAGAYCDYNNNPSNSNIYGRLYNYYTVVDLNKLCPTGWHVPTDAEWTTLTTYLGGESVAGDKLKGTDTTQWIMSNTEPTNETGFTGLPAGNRDEEGAYENFGYFGLWWSSTDYFSSAWCRGLNSRYSGVNRTNSYRRIGYSIRCLKD